MAQKIYLDSNSETENSDFDTKDSEENASKLSSDYYGHEGNVIENQCQDEDSLQIQPKYFSGSTQTNLPQEEDEEEELIYSDDDYSTDIYMHHQPFKHANLSHIKATEPTRTKKYKKKQILKSKYSNKASRTTQIKQEGQDYGRVMGKNTNEVFSFGNALQYKAHFSKKVRFACQIHEGSLVLIQSPRAPTEHVSVVHVYSPHEEARLLALNEIRANDPMLHLPREIVCLIFDYVSNYPYIMDSLRQTTRAWNAFCAARCPIRCQPRKFQFARRIADLQWEGLAQFHSMLVRGDIEFNMKPTNQCPLQCGSNLQHLRSDCGLRKKIAQVAKGVWNEFLLPVQKTISDNNIYSFISWRTTSIPILRKEGKYFLKKKEEVNSGHMDPPTMEYRLFTFENCFYLHFEQEELNNFGSCLLKVWIEIHQREDLDIVDLDVLIRGYLIQRMRSGIKGYIKNLRGKTAAASSREKPMIESEINGLENRWKSLLAQPEVDLNMVDFTPEFL